MEERTTHDVLRICLQLSTEYTHRRHSLKAWLRARTRRTHRPIAIARHGDAGPLIESYRSRVAAEVAGPPIGPLAVYRQSSHVSSASATVGALLPYCRIRISQARETRWSDRAGSSQRHGGHRRLCLAAKDRSAYVCRSRLIVPACSPAYPTSPQLQLVFV